MEPHRRWSLAAYAAVRAFLHVPAYFVEARPAAHARNPLTLLRFPECQLQKFRRDSRIEQLGHVLKKSVIVKNSLYFRWANQKKAR